MKAGYCNCGCGQKTSLAKSSRPGIRAGEPMRFIRGHQGKLRLTKENFLEHVVGRESGCLEWMGALSPEGYGRLGDHYAHRISFELWNGPIPEGKQIDHLCRNRKCVNPKHLEVVTPRENLLRGNGASAINARRTHCVNGHEFNDENTWYSAKGYRQCRVCAKLRMRDAQRKKRHG